MGVLQVKLQLHFFWLTGSVLNPMLEMIYTSPEFRSFQFDFNFYPRDEREALEVQKILQMFMFHQALAPEKRTWIFSATITV